jgi:hypothetical protein
MSVRFITIDRNSIDKQTMNSHAADRIADKVRSLISPKLEDVWVTRSWNSVASRESVSKAKVMVSHVLSLPSPLRNRLRFRLESRPRLKHFLIKIYSPLSRKIYLLRNTDKNKINMANTR